MNTPVIKKFSILLKLIPLRSRGVENYITCVNSQSNRFDSGGILPTEILREHFDLFR
jgi:hypothetical protein